MDMFSQKHVRGNKTTLIMLFVLSEPKQNLAVRIKSVIKLMTYFSYFFLNLKASLSVGKKNKNSIF